MPPPPSRRESTSALAARYRVSERTDSKRVLFRLAHQPDDGTEGESVLDGTIPALQPDEQTRKSSSFVRFNRISFSMKNSSLPGVANNAFKLPPSSVSTAIPEEGEEEPPKLELGVSLSYLKQLPIPPQATFAEACEYVKQLITEQGKSKGSFALYLLANPATSQYVGKATHFVSYAWSGGWEATMNALGDLFLGKKDPRVWMDFAVVDQFQVDRNFDLWARTFEDSLRAIGKAILVLTPAENPIATTRAWCCYEWFTIVKSEIPFDYCVNPLDVIELKQKITSGQVGLNFFNTLFSKINVEYAEAFAIGDATLIQKTLCAFGVVEVNDVVMMSVKEWLLGVVFNLQRETKPVGEEMVYVLSARAALHKVLGELDLAEMYYSQAVQMCRKCSSSYLAAALNNQALVLNQQGNFQASQTLFTESLGIQSKLFGKNHPDYALALSNHAQLLSSQGEFSKAEQLIREALAIFNRNDVGRYEMPLASCFNNLAGVLMSEGGKMNEAKHLYKEAIATWKRVLGNDHPQVATGLNNLSALYRETNRLELAGKLLDESLAIRKKVYGDEHHEIALCLNNLGMIRTLQGRTAEAEQAYREAIAIDLNTFGEDGLTTLSGLNNLAQLFIQLKGKSSLLEAEDILQSVAQKRKKLLGSKHVDYAVTLCDQGKVAMELGKYDEAKSLMLKAIEIWETSKQTKWLATGYNNLGLLEYRLNPQVQTAMGLFKQAIEIWKKFNGLDHPQVALGLANLGQACKDDTYFLEAVRILRLNPDNSNNKRHEVQMMCTMSAIYLELGELNKAEKLLMGELSKPGLELVTRRPKVFLRFVRARKADLLQAQNRLPQAIEAYLALLRDVLPDVADTPDVCNQLAGCYLKVHSVDLAEQYLRIALTFLREGGGGGGQEFVPTCVNLGNLLTDRGDHQEALDLFLLALDKDQRQFRALELHFKIATCLSRLDRFAHAEPFYRKVLDMDLASSSISGTMTTTGTKATELAADFNNLAVCLARQGKFKQAEEFAKKALDLDEQAGSGVDVGLDCFYLAQHIFDQQDEHRLDEVKALAKKSLLALQTHLAKDDINVQQVESFVVFLGI
ncbi:hypothetical protein BASA81_007086 [Batrachochytrium salamandrivorans]|nr:hypothetical protein BASA81_007086 [Batrachochytrium salamandrivorans]